MFPTSYGIIVAFVFESKRIVVYAFFFNTVAFFPRLHPKTQFFFKERPFYIRCKDSIYKSFIPSLKLGIFRRLKTPYNYFLLLHNWALWRSFVPTGTIIQLCKIRSRAKALRSVFVQRSCKGFFLYVSSLIFYLYVGFYQIFSFIKRCSPK